MRPAAPLDLLLPACKSPKTRKLASACAQSDACVAHKLKRPQSYPPRPGGKGGGSCLAAAPPVCGCGCRTLPGLICISSCCCWAPCHIYWSNGGH